METRTVLIVEDNEAIRESMHLLSEEEGFSVKSVANGREAIEYLAKAPTPCLVLLDLIMPVMSGKQFLAWLAVQPEPVRSIPVVVLSATSKPEDDIGQFKIAGCLTKPVGLEELVSVMEHYTRTTARSSRRLRRATPLPPPSQG